MIWNSFDLSRENCLSFSLDWVRCWTSRTRVWQYFARCSHKPFYRAWSLQRFFCWQNLTRFLEWNNQKKKEDSFPSISNPTLTLPSTVVSVMVGNIIYIKDPSKCLFFFFSSCWCSELEICILRWNMAFRHSPNKWLGFSLSFKSTSPYFRVKAFSNTTEILQSSDFSSGS